MPTSTAMSPKCSIDIATCMSTCSLCSLPVVYCGYLYTVDGERFAGLNFRGFSAIEVFTEIFLCCLGHKQCISTHYLV